MFLQGCFKDTLPATVYNIGGSLFDRVDFGRVSFRRCSLYVGALKAPHPGHRCILMYVGILNELFPLASAVAMAQIKTYPTSG